MPAANVSVGVDIEEVKRFHALLRNRRFMKRVFTEGEIAYCSAKKNKSQHFAVRFAAKEAVWKALSDWLRKNKARVTHRDIGIRNDPSGKPRVTVAGNLSRLESKISLSLSHTASHAVAVAIVQT